MKHFTTMLQRARSRNNICFVSLCLVSACGDSHDSCGCFVNICSSLSRIVTTGDCGITVTSQLVSVQGDYSHHHHGILWAWQLKCLFQWISISGWNYIYCHCQWNPEVPKVSLSQCLKQSIHRTYQGTLLQIFWQIGVGQCCVGGDICDAYKNALEDKRGPPPHR